MIEEKNIPPIQAPSMAKIAMATVVAILVATVLLFVAVLPAEYGIDPLKTGKALGLTDLAKASEKGALEIPAGSDAVVILPHIDGEANGAPAMKNTFIGQPRSYKVDSREYELAPGEGMEIKYNMKKGGGLIYSWTSSAKLSYEFHGEPNVKPKGAGGTDYYESYDIDDAGKDQVNGVFVAPSTGIHGWFWENKSKAPVKLKLLSSGFYDWVLENRADKETAIDAADPK